MSRIHRESSPLVEQRALILIVSVLAVAVMVATWIGITESRSDSLRLLVMEGRVLLESLAQAADNAIAAEGSIDNLVHLRYSEIVTRVLAQGQDQLDAAELTRVAAEHDLHAIYIYGTEGELIIGGVARGLQTGPPEYIAEEVSQLLDQPEDNYLLLLDQRENQVEWLHYYLEITNDLARVVVLVKEAGYYVEALQNTQIGYLAQNMARESGVEYIVYQSSEGIIFASRKIERLLAIESDPFLAEAVDSDSTVHRMFDFQGREVLELVRPFASSDYPFGVLRVGLSLEVYQTVTRRFDYVMIGQGAALFVLVVLAVLYISSRRRRKEISRRYVEMKTVTDRLFEQMSTGVAAVDAGGRIALANAAFERIFDVTAVVGRPWDEVAIDDRLRLAALPVGGDSAAEFEVVRSVGGSSRTLLVAVAGLKQTSDPSETLVIVAYDVTRLRRYEQEMARKKRLSEMGNLAAGVAHEIRNPLNTIAIAAQRLAAEFQPEQDSEQYRAITDQIRVETRRLNDIITRFLALARQERKARSVVRLDQLLDDMQKLFEPEARELGLELSILSEPDLRVEADPDSLRQVFINLFNNAKEAMAGVGTVSITAMRSEDQVRIQFTDTGPGIPVDIRDKVFTPYFTNKEGGTGLGLPTVHRIVTDLGGDIAIDRDVTEGASFIIRIPASSLHDDS